MTFLDRIEKIEKKFHRKPLVMGWFVYINPVARLGIRTYSFFFPFLLSLVVFGCIEILSLTVLKNTSLYGSVVIIGSIALILYFSFRDALKGGIIVTIVTILYYLFIIFSHHYTGQQEVAGVQTTFFLGFIYFIMAAIIGYLRSTLDFLIEKETDARMLAEENGRRLAGVLQQLPLGVLLVDKKRRVEGNKQLAIFLGERVGRYLQDGISSKTFRNSKGLAAAQWPIVRALTKGEVVVSEEMEYVRKDKKHIFLRVNAAPIKNNKNQIIGAVSTVDDITNKKQEEQAKYRLAALVESSEDAIMSKTLDGILTTWNKGAEKLFGYTAREAVGKHINLIVPRNLRKQEDEIIKKVSSGVAINHIETLRLKKNKKTVPVSMSISPFVDSEGKIVGVSNITRDITFQKELEKQKDNFIATASHELKTPLTSVKGFTQILQLFAKRRGDEKSLQLLEKMDGQVIKLTNLIGDLLDVTKMQSGQLPLNTGYFDFDEMLRGCVESMQLTTEKHTILLRGGVKKEVYGDRERTEQVIVNLISNAIKYSPNARQIIVSISLKKGNVEVAVQDFGIGIPKAKQKNVFKQFFRVSGPNTETFPGLGLGLYISNEIMHRLGGSIWVESKEGKGSTFYMSVPIRKRKIL